MVIDSDLRRVGYVSSQGPVVPSDGEFLPLENPATGRSIGEAFEIDAATLDEIIGEAVSTYRTTWRRVAPDQRGAMLARWADLIAERREQLADLEISDVGHLRREALATSTP